jgi:nucleotide-binding universal stress UspA family protein
LSVVPGYRHVDDLDDRARAEAEVRAPLLARYRDVLSTSQLVPGQHAELDFVEAVDVARTLDRYTATHPISVVIVGLHGREGLLHTKMGHVASHAVQCCHCPVLVVPEPAGLAPYPAEGETHAGLLEHLFRPFRQHREALY